MFECAKIIIQNHTLSYKKTGFSLLLEAESPLFRALLPIFNIQKDSKCIYTILI